MTLWDGIITCENLRRSRGEHAELGTAETLASDTTHGHAVVPIVVVGRVDVTGIEVQVVRVAAIVGRRRPVVAVVAGIVDSTVISVVVATTQEVERRKDKTSTTEKPTLLS